jgi:hypothetical protein
VALSGSVDHTHEANVAVLLWAAGGNVPLSALTGHDEDVSAQAVLRHRLAARLLARVAREGASWTTPAFIASLSEQQEQVAKALHVRVAELERLSSIVCELRPALLKGPTAYFITGDERCIRFSNDIDLLTDKPGELTTRLLDSGYRHSDDYCRLHEYSSLYRDGVNIDVHRYFPVIEGPRSVKSYLDLKSSDGISRALKAANERELTYDMFRSDSFPVQRAPGILRAGPTVGSLVACTHMFREYHDAAALLPYATVRLGELCEYIQMRQHVDFNEALFDDLVSRTGSGYSLEFAAYLTNSVFEAETGKSVEARYTHDVWLPGFSVLDDRAKMFTDLLIRPPESSASQFITDLKPTVITLDAHGVSPQFAFGEKDGSETGRALVHGSPGVFTYKITREAEHLRITITTKTEVSRRYIFLVCTGDYLYEMTLNSVTRQCVTTRRRNTSRPKSPSGTPKWKADIPCSVVWFPCGSKIEITLPWTLIGVRDDWRTLPLLLGIKSDVEARMKSPAGAVLVPMIIRTSPASHVKRLTMAAD